MRNYQAYANRSGGAAFNKALNYGRRLLQPQYWPELRRMAVKRLKNESPDLSQAERARAYCASIARDIPGAFAALNLESGTLPSFAGEHADRLTAAQARIDAANARMGGGADLDLLYALCVCSEARRVLETGVAFGWSTLAILSALEERRDGRLISIDKPYLGANYDDLIGLAVPHELRGRWTLLRGADRDRLEDAIAMLQPIDLAHYDSDKSEAGRFWAYPLIWEALRPGGILMSDDIDDNFAFFDFAEAVGVTPVVVSNAAGGKFAGVLRKDQESGGTLDSAPGNTSRARI